MAGHLTYVVLMHVYNEEEYLRAAINSIKKQSKQPLGIVIINDESTDGTQSIIEAYTDYYRCLTHSEIKPAFVRRAEAFNAGIQYIKHHFGAPTGILKVDADILLSGFYAEELLRHLWEPHVCAVSGVSTEYHKRRNLNNGAVMYRFSTVPKAKKMNGWDLDLENQLISQGFICNVDSTVSYTDLRPPTVYKPSTSKVLQNRLNRKISEIKGAVKKRSN